MKNKNSGGNTLRLRWDKDRYENGQQRRVNRIIIR
jgi:hypothetical protein